MANQAWSFSRRGRLSETLELVDSQITAPGQGEVTIEVKAASCNPVDVQLASSDDITLRLVGGLTQAPKVPAFDVSGVVHAVGAGVSDLAIGDEVFGLHMAIAGNGCLARYANVPVNAAGSVIIKKPSNMSFEQAAAIPLVYSTVHTALVKYGKLDRPAGAKERSVLILGGSGGTGSIGIQLAKQLGLRVVTTCSSKNIDFVKKLGADEVIDYTAVHVPQAALHSQYAPFAEVLDCVGGTELMPYLDHLILDDREEPDLGIYVTIVGDKTHRETMGGPVTNTFNPLQPLRAARGRLRDVLPSWVPLREFIVGKRYACIILEASKEQFESIEGFTSKGGKIIIDSVYSFGDAKKAYKQLESGRSVGKVVIKLGDAARSADTSGKAAFLGPAGSYSQQAAMALLGNDASLEPCATITDVYNNASTPLAIIPLENTIQGVVQETLACFLDDHPAESSTMAQQRWQIVQDFDLAVQHNLVVRRGTRLEDVTWVASHEQALGQCSEYLAAHLPRAKRMPTTSTATAATHLAICSADEGRTGAAICSTATAEELADSLQVVQKGVQNVRDNHTRFLLLRRRRDLLSTLMPPGNGRHFLTLADAELIPAIGGRLIAVHAQSAVVADRPHSQKYLVEVEGRVRELPAGVRYLGSV